MATDQEWKDYREMCICPECGKDEISHCECGDRMQVDIMDLFEEPLIKPDPWKLVEEIQEFRVKLKDMIK